MGNFGDFYNKKNRKKVSKEELARKAKQSAPEVYVPPAPEVIRKGKKDQEQNW